MAELPYQPVSFSAHAALTALEARRHLESIDTSCTPTRPTSTRFVRQNSKGQALRISWLPPSKNWISGSLIRRNKKEK